jgi:hypothetical protein
MNTRVLFILLAMALAGPVLGDEPEPCDKCGTIEAVIPRIVTIGGGGFYVYDVVVKMDKTGLRKRIPLNTMGAMDKGDRVRVWGGSVDPLPPQQTSQKKSQKKS